ncbi:MAG: cytochrome b5 domain-containing protein [Candidatus Altiarchaeota archaeon]|nr:cytochrome b5 domain-containing protein [Candidatus Altiarchaeota archaeon]
MKYLPVLAVIVILVGFASFSFIGNNKVEDKNTVVEVKELQIYTLSDVSTHSTQGDCWIVLSGKVYDVSEFTSHPGGEAILEGCGKDATTLFETRPMGSNTSHSEGAREKAEDFLIGTLVN